MAEQVVDRALIRDRDSYVFGCVELQELKHRPTSFGSVLAPPS